MADNSSFSHRILQFIRTHNNCCQLNELIRHFRVAKKTINQELYKMKREGVLEKVEGHPPKWRPSGRPPQAQHHDTFSQRGRVRGRGRGRGRGILHNMGRQAKFKFHGNRELRPKTAVDDDKCIKILQFLRSKTQPVKTIEIAKALGNNTSSEINPALYKMKQREQVIQATVKPVTWSVNIEQFNNSGNATVIPPEEDRIDPEIFFYEDGGGYSDSSAMETSDQPNMAAGEGSDMDNLDLMEEPVVGNNVVDSGGFGEGFNTLETITSVQCTEHSFLHPDNIKVEMQQSTYSESQNLQAVSENSNMMQHDDTTATDTHLRQVRVKEEHTSAPHQQLSPPNDSILSAMVRDDDTEDDIMSNMSTPQLPPQNMNTSDKQELSDFDKVLKVLFEARLKMLKKFIIVTLCKIGDNEYVQSILDEAVRLKYVDHLSGVYVLHDRGEAYIQEKLLICGHSNISTSISQNSSNIPTVPRHVKSAGKPLSPMELVNRQNGLFAKSNRSESDTVSSAKSTVPSLFASRFSSPQNVLSSSSETSSQSISGMNSNLTATGPMPLMSVDVKGSMFKPQQMISPHPLTRPSLLSLKVQPQSKLQGGINSVQRMPVPFVQSYQSSLQIGTSGNHQMVGVRSGNSVGRGRGGIGSFKPPPFPVDILRQQLKQTEISPIRTTSPSPSCSTTASFSNQSSSNLINSNNNSLSMSTHQGQGVSSQQSFIQQRNVDSGQPQSLPVMGMNSYQTPLSQGPCSLSLDFSTESFSAVNKNPVSALMEYAQSRHKVAKIEVIRQSGPSHRPKFIMGVFIGDEQISQVTCTNKKDGRKEAADMALRSLISSGKYNNAQSKAVTPAKTIPASQMTHFDRVAALTHKQFNMLVANISDNFAGRKVIAGLVMKTSEADMGTVISIGTGNRCITGEQMSLEGNTVNDSHAEIITRRGFIRFLYKKLLMYEPNKPDAFFMRTSSGRLKIRDGITFHLYISTAPCGDGALFSPRDTASNNAPLQSLTDKTHHPTFTSNVQGLLRTKMEGGEGTIPVEDDFVGQSFDGIQRGERLRTMSCTDKICRWNVVGMQGALLSHFLEPIYLNSLTLGFLFEPGHLARAVCCRVDKGDAKIGADLPVRFHLNHPWLGRVTAVEPSRETQKTKALSINWCFGDEKPEVTDGTKGLCYTGIEKGFFSRCTKKNLYDSFKLLCQKYGRQDLLQVKSYNHAKMLAKDYVQAKQIMLKKFKENGCGIWVSKPVEEEMFS